MTARETTLNGQHILSIEAATPSGSDIELRTDRRRQINASLSRNNQVELYINSVDASKVMTGRITDGLHGLFIGPVSIDITPTAATVIDAWLSAAQQAERA
jgi:hypothetical protein